VKPVAVARRYAQAVAEAAAAKDHGTLEKVAAEVAIAARAIGGDETVRNFFADPSVRDRDKQQAVEALAKKAKLHDLSRSFLGLLVRNRRMTDLPGIARALATIKDRTLGVVAAETTTAVPLTAAQQSKLKETLERLTGRTVRLETRVDPALIGGIRTRIGSRVYDGSLQRRIALMRERLAGRN
jgi:F-type H+-transporting ATPase subunit delta